MFRKSNILLISTAHSTHRRTLRACLAAPRPRAAGWTARPPWKLKHKLAVKEGLQNVREQEMVYSTRLGSEAYVFLRDMIGSASEAQEKKSAPGTPPSRGGGRCERASPGGQSWPSSLLSWHCGMPSHTLYTAMHSPLVHRNWNLPHCRAAANQGIT